MSDSAWKKYYEVHKDSPPSRLLTKAIVYCKGKQFALDLGAGPLNDTKFLLSEGFDVTAVDMSPLMSEAAQPIEEKGRLHIVQSAFENFEFPAEKFDLVNAAWSLPFTHPDAFGRVFEGMLSSLKIHGIFSGQLFGVRDTWATNTEMTFNSMDDAKALFKNFEVLSFEEQEKDGVTALGDAKHWHVFHIIARKT